MRVRVCVCVSVCVCVCVCVCACVFVNANTQHKTKNNQYFTLKLFFRYSSKLFRGDSLEDKAMC